MKSVNLYRNEDGSWTARIFTVYFNGSYDQCVSWLRNNGEYPP